MDQVTTGSARASRRATHAVLDAIVRTPELRDPYVLKGGLALHLAFGSPRFSRDIDLNAVEPVPREITDATDRRLQQFGHRLDAALLNVQRAHGFQRLVVENAAHSEELPALLAEVGYVSDEGLEGTVELQLTLSDLMCDTARKTVRGLPLHVATVEDILADKLKALLQQVTRDKVRSSDVFDIWYFSILSPIPVDPNVVSTYLQRKCGPADAMPPLAKDQFRRKSVFAHAAAEYHELHELLPDSFELPPFRHLYECVLEFVDRLDLPRHP